MNLKAGQTPISDRIAAGMSAAGGDRFFAPGADYRAGGFDGQTWCDEVNYACLRNSGYEVRMKGPDARRSRPEFSLWMVDSELKASSRLPISIDPHTMSGGLIFNICRLHRATLENGAAMERARLGIRPPSIYGKRRAAPAAAPEEVAAPAMGR